MEESRILFRAWVLIAVIESHPDNAREDLRLDCPFPGLVEFADSLDLSQMTKQVGEPTMFACALPAVRLLWLGIEREGMDY